MKDVLDELRDLHRQATEERSHHYTGAVILRSIGEIERLRRELRVADLLNESFLHRT